jgi:hypothetical protein
VAHRAGAEGSGNESLDIIIDPHSDAIPGFVPEDFGEGEGPFETAQEHALVGLIGIAEIIIGVVDRNRLPTLVREATRCWRVSSSKPEEK